MQLSIADILALPVIQEGKPEVIGGGAHLDRTVRWVHIAEVDDMSNMLQGDELVLTTGPALAVESRGMSYLEHLAEAGAAGVIVELGTYIDAIPPEVARAADEIELPVIALHRTIRFVDVTERVHRAIVADQYEEVAFARTAHEIFTDLSMKRAPLSDIVEAAAEMIGGSLVLEDLNRKVLTFSAQGQRLADLLADWERRSRLTPISNRTSVDGPEPWMTTPVGPDRQGWGRLVAPIPVDTSARTRMVIERAAQALALTRMVEHDRSAFEQQAQSGLVDELARGRIDDEADAAARAHALGLRSASKYVPITVRVTDSAPLEESTAHRRQLHMLDQVRHSVRSAHQSALTANRRTGQVDLLLACPQTGPAEDAIVAVCSEIRSALRRVDGILRCTIGVGPESSRLLDSALGLADSAHIADVAQSLPQDGMPYHRAKDIRLRGLLALIRTDPRVQAFAESELRGLLDHLARHGGDELDILRAFLESDLNKSDLAKRLHLSRPTLYTKLSAIERMLGVDLYDAESRTSLHTAILILDTRQQT
ncbi:PucR family transcriptional regulator [Rhodococcus koreensis]|uniref:Purine catabolism regulatory protein n=1 Tax=Rhodococcus koreensis TaxID=99653 RepID=A0A1H4KW55_9NOCA|nr:PucR family transcriptional regulator [Rhodococcus koreensis]SEB62315.1 purine catabolism regulatory protein [Rhodococcus koreensis]